MAAAPSRLRAFAGHDVLEGKPWWHQKISSDALRAVGFSVPADSAIKWHADYIDSYGYSPLWWAHDLPATGADRFRYSMAQVGELEKMHFDDLTSTDDVRAMWNRYLTGAFVGLQWAAEHNDVAAAHNIIGISLHSIEDFYSHSTWLNLPGRRDVQHTWLASSPAERLSTELYTGAYEHPETAIKHHGKINIMCTIMSQPALSALADALCTAISPMSNSSLCTDYKSCKDGTSVQYVVEGTTLPSGLMFLSPPGIALDNVNIARIGVKERGLVAADGRLQGARTQKPANEELFEVAVTLATAAATEWLQALERAMNESGQGEFWNRLKTMPDYVADPVLWSQFENFRNLPYMFMSAGAYPPDAAQRSEKDEVYLRVRLKTANEANAGTDGAVKLHAEGRTYDLDWAPYDALPMRINDFEQGDDFTYTVGPFDRVPGQIVIENRGVRMDDLEAALRRDLDAVITKIGDFIKNTALALVSGEADRVADNHLKFDLAQVRAAGSQAAAVRLNGGSEGDYTLQLSAARVTSGGIDAQHQRPWTRYRVMVSRLDCATESKWDRGSDSDEPFVLMSLLPMPYGGSWGQRQAGIIGPYEDLDSGEQVGVGYVFGDVDLPDDVGVLAFKAVQYESDDEPAEDRQALLQDLAVWLRTDSETQPSSMDILAQGIAGDWKLAEAEVYAFSRHPVVRGGTVLNQRVDQWVPSNSNITLNLDAGRARGYDAAVAAFVTPRGAALAGGGGGGAPGGDGGGELQASPLHNEFGEENVAFHKSTQQNTTDYGGVADRAVDGFTDGNFGKGSVTHTMASRVSWWSVDLGAEYDIARIRIWNRTDCCAERGERFVLLASKEPFYESMSTLDEGLGPVTPYFLGEQPQSFGGNRVAEVIPATPTVARYVRILLPRSMPLSLAEVQVFTQAPGEAAAQVPLSAPAASDGPNQALGKSARQSSTEKGGDASRAVDGNTNGSFPEGSVTHTGEEPTAWWEVDLGQVYDVSKVRIWNRTDCCAERLDGCLILVGEDPQVLDQMTLTTEMGNSENTTKALVGLLLQSSKKMPARYGPSQLEFEGAASKDITSQRNRRGRYVRIVQPRTHILSLAEVEVFGSPVDP